MDGVPSTEEEIHKLWKKSKQILSFLRFRRYSHSVLKPIQYIGKFMRLKSLCFLSDAELYRRYEDLYREHSMNRTERAGILTFDIWDKNSYYKKEWYGEMQYVPFEKISIPVSIHYHEMLSMLYGPEYMTPQQLPTFHGIGIIDLHRSYLSILPEIRKSRLVRLRNKIQKKLKSKR